jgi:hypothetical protein
MLSPNGNTAFTINIDADNGLYIFNVTNPAAPTRLGNYNDSQTQNYHAMALSPDGNTAFIIDHTAGHGLYKSGQNCHFFLAKAGARPAKASFHCQFFFIHEIL